MIRKTRSINSRQGKAGKAKWPFARKKPARQLAKQPENKDARPHTRRADSAWLSVINLCFRNRNFPPSVPSSLLTLPRSQNRHRNREHNHRQLKPSKSPLNRPWCPWLRELCQYISPQRVKRRFHVPSRVGPLARMLLARTHALPRPRPVCWSQVSM